MPNFAKFAQTNAVPPLNISDPFNVQRGQTVAAVIPKTPDTLLPRIPPQQSVCSAPLLRVQPDPSKNFTIKQAPAPRIDPAMAVKPLAPSCDQRTPVQKPGFTTPLPPNSR
jgi:hypothetical protein